MSREAAACGSWRSPIDAAGVARAGVRLSEPRLDGEAVYWLERRPAEGGRAVLMRRNADGGEEEILDRGFNVRTRVHEYGGGAYAVQAGHVWFVHDGDRAIYHQPPGGEAGRLTAPGEALYADLQVDAARRRLLCVSEDHSREPPAASLVAIGWDDGRVETLADGRDFYASPRLSPDGEALAWLCWDHPNMPWDAAECHVAALDASGIPTAPRHVAGGADESVFQPQWSPHGVLHLVSDRSEWWNLYRVGVDGLQALAPRSAEFGLPQWVFGQSTYAFTDEHEICCAFTRDGVWHLARWRAGAGLEVLPSALTEVSAVAAGTGQAVFIGASPTRPPALMQLSRQADTPEVVHESTAMAWPADTLSQPRAVTFPTGDGEQAHGLFYAPVNPDYRPRDGERPPLLVKCHGGPTGATSTALDPRIQFWTSRGIAVLDVNYRGSTGYGRSYRRRLYGQWGVFDVEDCVAGARHLAERGEVDGDQLLISGSSAGGYTVLCALTFHDIFAAGASYYGVADLAGLMRSTHKFEARYTDQLIGPWPEARARYARRSPLAHARHLSCPVIFLQGLQDKVVPPTQAEVMVAALDAKGVPHAYLTFPHEQHGFRDAANMERALAAELAFYARVLHFEPADVLPELAIRHARSL